MGSKYPYIPCYAQVRASRDEAKNQLPLEADQACLLINQETVILSSHQYFPEHVLKHYYAI